MRMPKWWTARSGLVQRQKVSGDAPESARWQDSDGSSDCADAPPRPTGRIRLPQERASSRKKQETWGVHAEGVEGARDKPRVASTVAKSLHFKSSIIK